MFTDSELNEELFGREQYAKTEEQPGDVGQGNGEAGDELGDGNGDEDEEESEEE
jgi:hypothetical protein